MNRNLHSLVWDEREINTKVWLENVNGRDSLDYLVVDWGINFESF